MEQKRIDYLDGLKGISALLVFIYHIAIIAFNRGYVGFESNYGTDATLIKEAIRTNFPAAIFTNNCFGLYLFFVMIAIFPIMSYRKHENDAAIMGRYAVKRYFQLLAPCFASGLIAVIFYWNGLSGFSALGEKLGCRWLLFENPAGCETVWDFLKTTFVSMWLSSDAYALSPMWCMSIIFLGSLAVYASYALFGNSKNRFLPCIILSVVSLLFPTMVYFAIGAWVAEFVLLKSENRHGHVFTALLLVVGAVLIKLPIQVYPITLKTEYVCGIGAGLFLWGVCRCEPLKKVLSCKWIVFLGRISFEIILWHFFFLSNIGCLFYGWLADSVSSPYLLTGLTFIILIPPTVFFSWVMNKFVSTPINKLLQKAVNRIF